MYMYQMAIRIVTGVHIMSDIYMYIGYDVWPSYDLFYGVVSSDYHWYTCT